MALNNWVIVQNTGIIMQMNEDLKVKKYNVLHFHRNDQYLDCVLLRVNSNNGFCQKFWPTGAARLQWRCANFPWNLYKLRQVLEWRIFPWGKTVSLPPFLQGPLLLSRAGTHSSESVKVLKIWLYNIRFHRQGKN